MPWLWLTAALASLALGSPGQAQSAADSLSAPVGADSLGQAIAPDSLAPRPADTLATVQADSPSQPALALPALLPSPVPPANPPPAISPLPKRMRYEARPRGLLSARTLWAAVCVGGSAVLYNRGGDYRDKADALYLRYKQATDPTEIEALYQRTTNQDTKGQVCWALGAALVVNGVRLLLSRETEVVSASARPSLHMILAPHSLQLRVSKWL